MNAAHHVNSLALNALTTSPSVTRRWQAWWPLVTRQRSLIASLLIVSPLLGLTGCMTMTPVISPAPVVVPPVSVNPAQPEPPPVETTAVAPTPTVEPAQPLPPANTRSYTLNSASRALVNQAETQRKSKNFVQAAATLERALRIEPNNPLLWLEYAELRMAEGNYAQADNLARKAVASASGDPRTQANAWRLVGDSLKARNQNSDAQQAYARANALIGR